MTDAKEKTPTPGPWEISQEPPRWIIQADAPLGKKAVAYMVGDYIACGANARLIAAAPTMADYIAKRAATGDAEAAAIMESIHAGR